MLLSLFAAVMIIPGNGAAAEPEICVLPPSVDLVPATFTLNDGHTMPRMGLGTAGLGDGTAKAVGLALEAGFRHIDTAQAYEWYVYSFEHCFLGSGFAVLHQSHITCRCFCAFLVCRYDEAAVGRAVAAAGDQQLQLPLACGQDL